MDILNTSKNKKTGKPADKKDITLYHNAILKEIYALSGKETLSLIVEHDTPKELIRGLPCEDIYWLIKKIGEDDCLPVLELASKEQWQYILDLEIWRKDRLSIDQAFEWLDRFQQANSMQTINRLFKDQDFRNIVYFSLFKSIRVEIINEAESYNLDKGFITFDGLFYFKVIDKVNEKLIENILRTMANKDLLKYQAFLLNIIGIIPAEAEEEIYRCKNIRLAEHGFLPFEEAVSMYTPLSPDALDLEEPSEKDYVIIDEDVGEPSPFTPLIYAQEKNLLTEAASRTTDPLFLDRINLEFAGLCNRIISADNIHIEKLEDLISISQKTAGFLNLTLEKLFDKDISSAERLLKKNHLISIFRVGFGLIMELKWKAGRWLKSSWFYRSGLDFSFWGNKRGQTLKGILQNKPLLYADFLKGKEFKNFERISELNASHILLDYLIVIDRVLENLTKVYPLKTGSCREENITCYYLIFNFWSRKLLNLEPSFAEIPTEKIKDFFSLIRSGIEKPPYRMPWIEDVFIRDFMEYSSGLDPEERSRLKEMLSIIWNEFQEEFEFVSVSDLDWRFSSFFQANKRCENRHPSLIPKSSLHF